MYIVDRVHLLHRYCQRRLQALSVEGALLQRGGGASQQQRRRPDPAHRQAYPGNPIAMPAEADGRVNSGDIEVVAQRHLFKVEQQGLIIQGEDDLA